MNAGVRATREEIDTLGEQIAEASAHIDAATHSLLSTIRRRAEADSQASS